MKMIISTLSIFALTAYMVLISGFVNSREKELLVADVIIIVKDSLESKYINRERIFKILENNNFIFEGKAIDEINLNELEKFLGSQQIIKSAEAYFGGPGILKIDIRQREPFIRIINASGKGYYLDEEGFIIPLSEYFSPHVLLATGFIREPFTINQASHLFIHNYDSISKSNRVIRDIYILGQFISKDDLWKSQIEQIYVNSKYEFELVPRVGPHIIEFGNIEDMEEKFAKLKLLYSQGFASNGWNQYQKINLKYKNQVVCTKI